MLSFETSLKGFNYTVESANAEILLNDTTIIRTEICIFYIDNEKEKPYIINPMFNSSLGKNFAFLGLAKHLLPKIVAIKRCDSMSEINFYQVE